MTYWLARMYHNYHEIHYWNGRCLEHGNVKARTEGDIINERPKCSICGNDRIKFNEIDYYEYKNLLSGE